MDSAQPTRWQRFVDWYVYRSPPGRLIQLMARTPPAQAFGRFIERVIEDLR